MSFVLNNNNQINLNDSIFNLTERERRFLEKSWSKTFAENVFTKNELGLNFQGAKFNLLN